jgi:hypothetical protein
MIQILILSIFVALPSPKEFIKGKYATSWGSCMTSQNNFIFYESAKGDTIYITYDEYNAWDVSDFLQRHARHFKESKQFNQDKFFAVVLKDSSERNAMRDKFDDELYHCD